MGMTRERSQALAEFGRRARAARHRRGWTLEQLGEVSGLHWTYLGQCERGRRNISLLNIIRMAEALEINPAEMVDDLKNVRPTV